MRSKGHARAPPIDVWLAGLLSATCRRPTASCGLPSSLSAIQPLLTDGGGGVCPPSINAILATHQARGRCRSRPGQCRTAERGKGHPRLSAGRAVHRPRTRRASVLGPCHRHRRRRHTEKEWLLTRIRSQHQHTRVGQESVCGNGRTRTAAVLRHPSWSVVALSSWRSSQWPCMPDRPRRGGGGREAGAGRAGVGAHGATRRVLAVGDQINHLRQLQPRRLPPPHLLVQPRRQQPLCVDWQPDQLAARCPQRP